MKEQLRELVGLLRQSEMRRVEAEKELKSRDQTLAVALATPPPVKTLNISSILLVKYSLRPKVVSNSSTLFFLPGKPSQFTETSR